MMTQMAMYNWIFLYKIIIVIIYNQFWGEFTNNIIDAPVEILCFL
jgi:hypothetical protein